MWMHDGPNEVDFIMVPGWKGSGPEHWQSHWQQLLPGAKRLSVQSWDKPDPDDWIRSLDGMIRRARRPVVLIAHSLGCVTIAHWVECHGREAALRVAGALLVAPADVERPGAPDELRPFAPLPRTPLPFPALILGSETDPTASSRRVWQFGDWWGAETHILGDVGHINTESGHRQWPEGMRWLARLPLAAGVNA
ncbi:RBBP9/YdeN family alpha/beta hydrolase [Zobellella iuensis]|uniref:Alpha/beta hydrolase n=1 Tax=Zobellella iuensis TaxID=2803811 RepID=A0ABS1QNB6_9GAMM|nr:alpha/beta hydrolase [Zobellella iuensis]MBL1376335.1 alpha/beta hydrolase [Zobellella iuensis]